jgi:DNA-binding SARP family transcriptional activator
MEFRLLGPVEAKRDNVKIPLPGSKINTVLAALLLARGRMVSDARLSSLLWGWSPPPTMNAQIYTYISRLRKQLSPDVDIARLQPGYVFHAQLSKLDILQFELLDRLGREAFRQGNYEAASHLLTKALDLWRGPALANVTEFLTEEEAPRLEEMHMATLEFRIAADLALSKYEQVTTELYGLIARYPLREKPRMQLMYALHQTGRQAEALDVYHTGRKVLADELGIDPGPDLRTAYQAVLGDPTARFPGYRRGI